MYNYTLTWLSKDRLHSYIGRTPGLSTQKSLAKTSIITDHIILGKSLPPLFRAKKMLLASEEVLESTGYESGKRGKDNCCGKRR